MGNWKGTYVPNKIEWELKRLTANVEDAARRLDAYNSPDSCMFIGHVTDRKTRIGIGQEQTVRYVITNDDGYDQQYLDFSPQPRPKTKREVRYLPVGMRHVATVRSSYGGLVRREHRWQQQLGDLHGGRGTEVKKTRRQILGLAGACAAIIAAWVYAALVWMAGR